MTFKKCSIMKEQTGFTFGVVKKIKQIIFWKKNVKGKQFPTRGDSRNVRILEHGSLSEINYIAKNSENP